MPSFGANMLVPFGSGRDRMVSANTRDLGVGRRVWVGGTVPANAYGHGPRGREPTEVLLPPGRCLYFWLGCEGTTDVGPKCQSCHERDEAEEAELLEAARKARAERRRDSKNAWARQFRDTHREEVNRAARERRAAQRRNASPASARRTCLGP